MHLGIWEFGNPGAQLNREYNTRMAESHAPGTPLPQTGCSMVSHVTDFGIRRGPKRSFLIFPFVVLMAFPIVVRWCPFVSPWLPLWFSDGVLMVLHECPFVSLWFPRQAARSAGGVAQSADDAARVPEELPRAPKMQPTTPPVALQSAGQPTMPPVAPQSAGAPPGPGTHRE